MAQVHSLIHRADELPVRSGAVVPFAFGSEASCAVLEGTPWVLKVYRFSLGQDVRTLVEMARRLECQYKRLSVWYELVPGFLPRTVHVVLRAPLGGVRAAARIQERVSDPARDLLMDFSDDDLVALACRYPRFGEHFQAFTAATRRAWDDEGRFLDMVGASNVLVIHRGPEPELRAIDFGIVDLEERRRTGPAYVRRATQVLERLERIAARATSRVRNSVSDPPSPIPGTGTWRITERSDPPPGPRLSSPRDDARALGVAADGQGAPQASQGDGK